VRIVHGKIAGIEVVRGAPCGASWEAAARLQGVAAEDAVVRMGLEAQFFCTADSAGWDPISGKSPVHLAGELHSKALHKALTLSNKEEL